MEIQIQVNGNDPSESHEELTAHIDATVKRATSHFRDRISCVDVQLNKEKHDRDSDKRCVMETRLEGLLPIVTTYLSESFNHAVDGASAKLKATLKTEFGHRKQH